MYIHPSTNLWTVRNPGPCATDVGETSGTSSAATGAALCPTGLSSTSWTWSASWTSPRMLEFTDPTTPLPVCHPSQPITPTTLDRSCPDVITASTCSDPSSCTDCCQSSSLALNSDRTAYFNDYAYFYIDPSTNLWTSSQSLCTESRNTFTSSSAVLCPTGISSTSWSSGAFQPGSTLEITAPYVVSTSFTLDGSLADYDTPAVRSSIKSTLATAAGVSPSNVILTLAAGSVVVTAVITVETQAAATTMSNTLETGILASPAALQSALTAQFQADGVSSAALTVQGLTPAAVAAPTADSAAAFPIGIVIGAVAVVVALLVLAVVVACMLKKKDPKVSNKVAVAQPAPPVAELVAVAAVAPQVSLQA